MTDKKLQVASSQAGTIESSDSMVFIEPISCDLQNSQDNNIQIEIKSSVYSTFGNSIRETVLKSARKYNLSNVRIVVNDRGALPIVLEARLETAIKRAVGIVEK